MLSTSYNDTQAEILYKGDAAAVCSFTTDNIRKAQDQGDWIKQIIGVKEFQMLQKNHFSSRGFDAGDENNQVILPSRLKPLAFKELHIDVGQLGYDRTLELIKERFIWPKMYDDAKAVTRRCSVKKVFLEISQNSQENTCTRDSFLIKSKNTFSYRTSPVAASDDFKYFVSKICKCIKEKTPNTLT